MSQSPALKRWALPGTIVFVLLLALGALAWPRPAPVEAVAVLRIGPDDGADAVALEAPLTVEFSAPVVDAAELEAAADDPRVQRRLPQPLALTRRDAPGAPVAGNGRWLTPSLFRFAPADGLEAATTYSATVLSSLALPNGRRIAGERTWSFTTASPLLLGARPFAGASNVAASSPIVVFLAPQVDASSAMQRFQLADLARDRIVEGTVAPVGGGFVFQPAAPLALGSAFEARLLGGIRSAEGRTLRYEPPTWRFTTLRHLEVARVTPPAAAADVALDTPIRVLFNRPVVTLAADAPQGGLPQPLQIQPALDGSGRWVAPDTYVFTPTVAMRPSTSYTVQIAGGLTDAAGVALQGPFAWRFATAALPEFKLLSSDARGMLLPDAALKVDFNQPVTEQSVRGAIMLVRDTGEPVAGQVAVMGSTAVFTPAQLLDRGQVYAIIVAPGVQSAETGAVLRVGERYTFRVVGQPEFLPQSSTPRPNQRDVPPDSMAFGSSGVRLYFSVPMDWASVERNLAINPPARILARLTRDDFIVLDLDLEVNTAYRITIGADARDRYGLPLANGVTLDFVTGGKEASVAIVAELEPKDGGDGVRYGPAHLSFPDNYGIGTYNAYDDARIALRHVNAPEVRYQIYQLRAEQVITALVGSNFGAIEGVPLREATVALGGQPNKQWLDLLNLGRLEPGLYRIVVRPPNSNSGDYQMMAVSRYALTIKRSAEQVLVWAVDLASGAPVPDLPLSLSFYDTKRYGPLPVTRPLGRTNADGVLQTSLTNLSLNVAPGDGDRDAKPFFISSPPGERFAFASTTWDRDISASSFGLETGDARVRVVGNVYTDRPLYRPGDAVGLRGMLRVDVDRVYQLPRPGQRVRVEVRDPRGNSVLSALLPLNATGSFSASLLLDGLAPSGVYNIYSSLEGERLPAAERDAGAAIPQHHVLGSFVVAEYRKPTFEVVLTPNTASALPNTTVTFSMLARYFTGEPLTNARVAWYLVSAPIDAPAGAADGFSFSQIDGDQSSAIVTRRVDGTTSARGELEISQSVGAIPLDRRLVLNVEVFDVISRQSSFAQASIVASPDTFDIGLRPSRAVARPYDPLTVDLLALRSGWQPVAGQPISLTLSRRLPYTAREQGSDGRFYTVMTYEDQPIVTLPLTTAADGTASAALPPLEGGIYVVKASGIDRVGAEVEADAPIYVYGDKPFWGVDNTNQVRLIADRDSYAPGDTALLLVPAPYPGMTALLTIERGDVLEYRTATLTGTTGLFSLPITADHTPNIFVSVVLVKAPDANTAAPDGEARTPIPDVRVGMTELRVPIARQELRVEISSDRPEARPQQPVTFTVRVTDAQGRGVRAELSLAMVDRALLSLYENRLAGDPTPTYTGGLFGRRLLGVATSNSLVPLVDRVTLRVLPGSKGGGGGLTDDLLVRRNFKDTAYWNPSLMTDDEGLAQVTIPALPDNLTTWRMVARALTADTRFGQGQADVVVSKRLALQPLLPATLRVGDRATIAARVRNDSGARASVTVALDVSGARLGSPASQQIDLPPCSADPAACEGRLTWALDADEEGTLALHFRAEADDAPDLRDDVALALEVRHYRAPDTLVGGGQLVAAGAVALPVPAPGAEVAAGVVARRELVVEVLPSLGAALEAGVRQLAAAPFVTSEQTVSGLLPQLAALAAGWLSAADQDLLLAQEAARLQRLAQLQNLDGGWGWSSGERLSDPFITAYVVQGMAALRSAGRTVDAAVLERAIDYLRNTLNDAAQGGPGAEPARSNTRSHVLYALTLAGRTDVSRSLALYERRAQLTVTGRAWLLMSLLTVGGQEAQAQTLANEIASAAVPRADDVFWTDGDANAIGSDAHTTALAVQALALASPRSPLVSDGTRYLLGVRLGDRWATSYETAQALLALHAAAAAPSDQPSYSYRAALDSQEVIAGSASADNATAPVSATLPLASDAAGLLTFERASQWLADRGSLFYQARVRTYYNAAALAPADHGLGISRAYVAVDPTTLRSTYRAIDRAVANDLVLVTLTITVPQTTPYLIVEDALPAGLEPLNIVPRAGEALVEAAAPSPSLPRSDQESFSHVELYADRVVLLAAAMPAGTYRYTYVARATTVGTFAAPPASAYRAYAPHVFGRSAGAQFAVVERDVVQQP